MRITPSEANRTRDSRASPVQSVGVATAIHIHRSGRVRTTDGDDREEEGEAMGNNLHLPVDESSVLGPRRLPQCRVVHDGDG